MRIVDCECAAAAVSALAEVDQPVDEFFVGVEDVGALLDTTVRVHDEDAGACEENIFDARVVDEDLKGAEPEDGVVDVLCELRLFAWIDCAGAPFDSRGYVAFDLVGDDIAALGLLFVFGVRKESVGGVLGGDVCFSLGDD